MSQQACLAVRAREQAVIQQVAIRETEARLLKCTAQVSFPESLFLILLILQESCAAAKEEVSSPSRPAGNESSEQLQGLLSLVRSSHQSPAFTWPAWKVIPTGLESHREAPPMENQGFPDKKTVVQTEPVLS